MSSESLSPQIKSPQIKSPEFKSSEFKSSEYKSPAHKSEDYKPFESPSPSITQNPPEAAAPLLPPINLVSWVERNREFLQPPVCNKLVFEENGFFIMVVGGPNQRKDFHVDEGPEFFYQIEGDMVLKTVQSGKVVDVPIREGEVFLLPPLVPHSPQRFKDTVGLVIERRRLPHERDGLQWYCDNCHAKLYEEFFVLKDIETDFPPVFDRFFSSETHRTCQACKTVMPLPE